MESDEHQHLNEGLPAIDPAKVAETQAAALQADVARGGAAGAALGGAIGILGSPVAAVTGAATGACAEAHTQWPAAAARTAG